MDLCKTLKIKALGLLGLAITAGFPDAYAGWGLIPGPRFQTGRESAMGGAYLPVGEDVSSALFNNPADAARFKGSRLDILNAQFYGNRGYTDTMTLSLSGTNMFDVFSLESSSDTLKNNPGVISGAGVSVMTGYAFKNYFAIGMLLQNSQAAISDGTSVTYRSKYELIPTFSAGLRLASGIVRLGYNLQWVNQAMTPATGTTVPLSTANKSYTDALLQGSGLAHSAGFSMTLPISMLPSFNFVARNIMGTSYSMPSLLAFSSNPSGTPATEAMTLDASLSIQPKLGSGMYMNWVLQYRDISNTSGVAFLGRLCTGVELSFSDRFFVRAGWGSNYPSIGLGLRNGKGDINLTYYNEEYGTQYNSIREPRFLAQFLMRAF